MAHALRRISYATCDPQRRLFCFLAREPKGHFSLQYCHSFLTTSSEQVSNILHISLVFFLLVSIICIMDSLTHIWNVSGWINQWQQRNEYYWNFLIWIDITLHKIQRPHMKFVSKLKKRATTGNAQIELVFSARFFHSNDFN